MNRRSLLYLRTSPPGFLGAVMLIIAAQINPYPIPFLKFFMASCSSALLVWVKIREAAKSSWSRAFWTRR